MFSFHFIVAVILSPLLAGATWMVYQCFISPLSSFDGPFWATVSRAWKIKRLRNGNLRIAVIELHQAKGSFVRIASNELSISDPQLIAKFLKFPVLSRSVPEYAPLPHDLLTDIYGSQSMKEYQLQFDTAILRVLPEMEKRMDNSFFFLNHWLLFFAIEALGEAHLSKWSIMVWRATDFGLSNRVDEYHKYRALAEEIPWMNWWNRVASGEDRTAVYGRKLATNKWRRDVQWVIQKRREDNVQKRDVLGRFLAAQSSGKYDLSDDDLIKYIGNQLEHGVAPLAHALAATMMLIHKHPHVINRLNEEIDEKWKEGMLSDPVRYEEALRMPYLRAVVCEALRLIPPEEPSSRVVPHGGMWMDGVLVPSGTILTPNIFAAHRNSLVVPDEAGQFKPERWLHLPSDDPLHAHFFAFGSKFRNCIGSNLSLMLILKLVPTLLFHYKYEEKTRDMPDSWLSCRRYIYLNGDLKRR